MIEPPNIEFREQYILSISGEREGWFWGAEKMESGLESPLESDFFPLNFVIKNHEESLLEIF